MTKIMETYNTYNFPVFQDLVTIKYLRLLFY